ncbi:hypothetical protein HYH03_011336 [Edaphochlamys debaryana]|uniref:J domain-containing protein n=1 Tax=Edaphochlamys debaryana TaxID=47281 RepID=A0A836BWK5_9CHLO|nr:hypothetical protein HYH03_011336 [Edaphochlamys debaryana]|eukprot:KAG2490209.1 hypothetical protein HYH03_011336 [Edaphochlamys debaryana]
MARRRRPPPPEEQLLQIFRRHPEGCTVDALELDLPLHIEEEDKIEAINKLLQANKLKFVLLYKEVTEEERGKAPVCSVPPPPPRRTKAASTQVVDTEAAQARGALEREVAALRSKLRQEQTHRHDAEEALAEELSRVEALAEERSSLEVQLADERVSRRRQEAQQSGTESRVQDLQERCWQLQHEADAHEYALRCARAALANERAEHERLRTSFEEKTARLAAELRTEAACRKRLAEAAEAERERFAEEREEFEEERRSLEAAVEEGRRACRRLEAAFDREAQRVEELRRELDALKRQQQAAGGGSARDHNDSRGSGATGGGHAAGSAAGRESGGAAEDPFVSPFDDAAFAAARPPVLSESTPVRTLRQFLAQADARVESRACKERRELLALARERLNAWHVRRAAACSRLPGNDGDWPLFGLVKGTPVQQDVIAREFKDLALRLHPDKNPGDPLATAAFQYLQAAHGRVRVLAT